MPFGCSIACRTWEVFATFLEFCVSRQAPVVRPLHYLDDYLMGASGEPVNVPTHFFFDKINSLGVPIASDKTEGPTTKLLFLGLELDSEEMEVRIPLPTIRSDKTKDKRPFKTNAVIDRFAKRRMQGYPSWKAFL